MVGGEGGGEALFCDRTAHRSLPQDKGFDGMVEIMVDVRTGIDAKDYSTVAKQEHLGVLELELKKLEDEVKQVTPPADGAPPSGLCSRDVTAAAIGSSTADACTASSTGRHTGRHTAAARVNRHRAVCGESRCPIIAVLSLLPHR